MKYFREPLYIKNGRWKFSLQVIIQRRLNLKITRNKSLAVVGTETNVHRVRPGRSFKGKSSLLLCLTSLTFIDQPLKLSYYDNFYVSLLYHAIILVVYTYTHREVSNVSIENYFRWHGKAFKEKVLRQGGRRTAREGFTSWNFEIASGCTVSHRICTGSAVSISMDTSTLQSRI